MIAGDLEETRTLYHTLSNGLSLSDLPALNTSDKSRRVSTYSYVFTCLLYHIAEIGSL